MTLRLTFYIKLLCLASPNVAYSEWVLHSNWWSQIWEFGVKKYQELYSLLLAAPFKADPRSLFAYIKYLYSHFQYIHNSVALKWQGLD